MKRVSVKIIAILIVVAAYVNAQFMPEESIFDSRSIGLNLNSSRDVAGLMSHLQMQHSISMSVGSSAFGSQSLMAYQNNFYLPLSRKLRLFGTLSVVQPTFSSGLYTQMPFANQPQVYYDTRLEYRVGDNATINIGLSNQPRYYYNPYRANIYGVPGRWQENE